MRFICALSLLLTLCACKEVRDSIEVGLVGRQVGSIAAAVDAVKRDGIAMPRGSDATVVLARMRADLWESPLDGADPNVPAVLFVYMAEPRDDEWPTYVISNPLARSVQGHVKTVSVDTTHQTLHRYEAAKRYFAKAELYDPSGQRVDQATLWSLP